MESCIVHVELNSGTFPGLSPTPAKKILSPSAGTSKICEKQQDYSWAKFRSEMKGGTEKRRVVHCSICVAHQDIARIHYGNSRLPAICTNDGAVFRQTLVKEHECSKWHIACMIRARQEKVSALAAETQLEKTFRFINSELAMKMSRVMLQVYNDAKRGTLSAWSYPSRYVASLIGERLQLSEPHSNFTPSNTDLQYISPGTHRDLLLTIADVDRKKNSVVPDDILALSLRIDGAVDKQRLDNKHVMAKYIAINGDEKTVYLGFCESHEVGSLGLWHAAQEAAEKSGKSWAGIFGKSTSIVTDGEASNTGTHHSLWTFLSEERKMGPEPNLPLLKIWCAVHRTQLAYKDMAKSVPEVHHITSDCACVGTFYRSSAVKTKGIKAASEKLKVPVVQFPAVTDIRFTEYSYKLMVSVLQNYGPMISHLQTIDTPEAKGILCKWLDEDTLQLTAVLTDALFLYKRFQKLIQSDNLNIFDLESARDHCISNLTKLLQRPLPGGQEENIHLVNKDDPYSSRTFADVALVRCTDRKKGRHNLFVTSRHRDVTAVKKEIVMSLVNFLRSRLNVEKAISQGSSTYAGLLKALSPACMKAGDATEEEISSAYSTIVPELSKKEFCASYGELVTILKESRATSLQEILKTSLMNIEWKTVSTAIARIMAAKPHSCDVERLISAYNLLKVGFVRWTF
jgi:hypothetical protein